MGRVQVKRSGIGEKAHEGNNAWCGASVCRISRKFCSSAFRDVQAPQHIGTFFVTLLSYIVLSVDT